MIETKQLRVTAGGFELGPIDLRIELGEYAVLTGPTGSGKTTLLEAIAGLRPIASGAILLGGADATGLSPADRRLGYVPQDGVLFGTMTVRDNLAFGPRARGASRAEALNVAAAVAERLAIAPLLDRLPDKLSGGERRRVALGRALATRPKVLLLDEPLGSLDPATQQALRGVLRDLHAEQGFTVLHVSHHEEDARALASVALEMQEGRLIE